MPLDILLLLFFIHPHRPKLRPTLPPLPNPTRKGLRPRNLRPEKVHHLLILLLLDHRRLPHSPTIPENNQKPSIPRRAPTSASLLEILPCHLVLLAPPSSSDLQPRKIQKPPGVAGIQESFFFGPATASSSCLYAEAEGQSGDFACCAEVAELSPHVERAQRRSPQR